MKSLIFTCCTLFSITTIYSQLRNISYNSPEFSRNVHVTKPAAAGGWIIGVGGKGLNFSELNGPELVRMDQNGAIIWRAALETTNPVNEVRAIDETADGHIVVSVLGIICTSGFFSNTLYLFDANGNQIWSKKPDVPILDPFASLIFLDIAVDESTNSIWTTGDYSVISRLQFDLTNGDLLYMDTISKRHYNAVERHPIHPGWMIWGGNSIDIFEGTILVEEIMNGEYITDLYTRKGRPEMIFWGTNGLTIIKADKTVKRLIFDYVNRVYMAEDKFWTLSYFSPTIVRVYAYDNLTAPDLSYISNDSSGLNIYGMLMQDDTMRVVGAERSGYYAFNGGYDFWFPHNNYNLRFTYLDNNSQIDKSNTSDAGLTNIQLAKDGIVVSLDSSGTKQMRITACSVLVKNYGTDLLESVTINAYLYAISNIPCAAPVTYKQRFDALHILPGEEKVINLGAFPKAIISDIGLCFWTTFPNDRTDLNHNNDVTCIDTFQYALPPVGAFNIVPNPVHDQLFVSLPIQNLFSARFRIYNLTGQLEYEGFIESDLNYYRINTSTLSKGMHILKIGDNVAKFMKE